MRDDIDYEERGIYVVIFAAMIPIVIGTLVAHDVFDAGSTISLGLLVLAVLGLFGRAALARRERRIPVARIEER